MSPGLDAPSGNFQPLSVRPIPDSPPCKYVCYKFISLGYLVLPSLNKAFTYLLCGAVVIGLESSRVTENSDLSPSQ